MPMTEDERRRAVLFNDVCRAPWKRHVMFSDRKAIADYLWEQGWRRDVRPEDVTEPSKLTDAQRQELADMADRLRAESHNLPDGV